jgi:DNA-binding transcriptional LysR family regulator
MKLGQLRTFVAVADSGRVARAAARLNLTQSVASRQISALEIEFEPLLDRVGRRVQLTSEGTAPLIGEWERPSHFEIQPPP